jgi:hypothetical protein
MVVHSQSGKIKIIESLRFVGTMRRVGHHMNRAVPGLLFVMELR